MEKKERLTNAFLTIVLLIVVVLVLRFIFIPNVSVSVYSILDFFSNLQPLNLIDAPSLVITESWGFFDFLRIFVNSLLSILDFLAMVINLVANAFGYAFQIFTYLVGIDL